LRHPEPWPGAAEDDPATWAVADTTGLSRSFRRDKVFTVGCFPMVRGAADDLLGRTRGTRRAKDLEN
jgi:hypothetical protein